MSNQEMINIPNTGNKAGQYPELPRAGIPEGFQGAFSNTMNNLEPLGQGQNCEVKNCSNPAYMICEHEGSCCCIPLFKGCRGKMCI